MGGAIVAAHFNTSVIGNIDQTLMKTTNHNTLNLLCEVTCQNQAFVAEISSPVMILLRKNVNLAFI